MTSYDVYWYILLQIFQANLFTSSTYVQLHTNGSPMQCFTISSILLINNCINNVYKVLQKMQFFNFWVKLWFIQNHLNNVLNCSCCLSDLKKIYFLFINPLWKFYTHSEWKNFTLPRPPHTFHSHMLIKSLILLKKILACVCSHVVIATVNDFPVTLQVRPVQMLSP